MNSLQKKMTNLRPPVGPGGRKRRTAGTSASPLHLSFGFGGSRESSGVAQVRRRLAGWAVPRLAPPTQGDSSHFPASLTRGRGGAGKASGCWRVRAFHHLVASSGARRPATSCRAPRGAVASFPRGPSRSARRGGLPPPGVGKLQPRAGGPGP